MLQFSHTKWIESIQWNELSALFDQIGCETSGPFLNSIFFKSWIGAKANDIHAFVLYLGETPQNFILVGNRIQNRFGIRIKTACLNQTGNSNDDQIWIEYNSTFNRCSDENYFYKLLFKELTLRGYHQVHFSMASSDIFQSEVIQRKGLSSFSVNGYSRTLDITTTTDTILSDLSPNSRAKLRRSIKTLKLKFGEVNIEHALSLNDKDLFFSELSVLHRNRWGHTSTGSGFDNKVFNQTMLSLLRQNPSYCEILRVKAGATTLGYTLNLLHQNSVYFYCSGIDHTLSSNHIKPGYVLHLFAMEYYARKGYISYDFMGGESQYKRTLCSERTTFWTVDMPLKNLKGYLVRATRALKNLRIVKVALKPLLDYLRQ